MPNRLQHENSPYLLQHQDNPVDWWPWCAEAFELACEEDKPVFLSIGYSACHWCHVMERESFEDPSIAAFLNDHFVSIKVDREERPDIDQIYMQAVMALTSRGGWPLNVFLTPQQDFFYGGTYWPPAQTRGMPGFDQVLRSVLDAYQQRRDQVDEQSRQVTQHLQQVFTIPAPHGVSVGASTLEQAVVAMHRVFDATRGGFGSAPKFPHPMELTLLIRLLDSGHSAVAPYRAQMGEMVQVTLHQMARGGLFDQLGGGFARYSVDDRWLVPHFEKMLYDNAQLASVYLEAFATTGDSFYEQVTRQTLDYLLRDMLDDGGGFHSAEDADSEGVEGKFYVWDQAEIEAILGREVAERFCQVYGVSATGNFEGQNILNLAQPVAAYAVEFGMSESDLRDELQEARSQLLSVRSQRVRPGKDDKVLVSWNGLAIDAFASAGRVLGEPRYLAAARGAAEFILDQLFDGQHLLHTWRHGQAKLAGFLDDYACLINGLVSLHQADLDPRWVDEASTLAESMIQRFADPAGGFFFTASDQETLIVRTKDQQDGSVPSGNSMAATALLRLGRLLGKDEWVEMAANTIQLAAGLLEQAPTAASQMLVAFEWWQRLNRHLVLVADPSDGAHGDLRDLLQSQLSPGTSLISHDGGEVPAALGKILAGKQLVEGEPTLYQCVDYSCQHPIVGAAEIRKQYLDNQELKI